MNTIEPFLTHLFERAPRDLPAHIPFREYLETCMFHPELGYYGGGRVRIGNEEDYWTFPVRMSPVFGEILSQRVMELWRAIRPRVEAADGRFTMAEVGGGRGELLRDLLLALRQRARSDLEAAALLERIDPLAVDKSASLLTDQAQTLSELGVRFANASIAELETALPRPFHGMLFANEVLSLLAPELLRIEEEAVCRLSVLPWLNPVLKEMTGDGPLMLDMTAPDPTFRPLVRNSLPDLMRALAEDPVLLKGFIEGRQASWTGVLDPIDLEQETAIAGYLDFLQPAIDRLRGLSALPAWVLFAPEGDKTLAGLARVLSSGAGAFLTIDYGGTAYHVLDNHSKHPHLRTYSRYLEEDETTNEQGVRRKDIHNPFYAPGCADLTYDLDFTWVAHCLKARGLGLCCFSHQGALAGGVDLWSKPYQDKLVAGRLREGYQGVEAVIHAHGLVKRFLGGSGFRLLVMATDGLEGTFPSMGPSDPLFFEDFDGLTGEFDRPAFDKALMARLVDKGFSSEDARSITDRCLEAIHPTGSLVDDLGDVLMYDHRFLVMDLLRNRPSKLPG